MKSKLWIGALVAAIIIFIWQFLAWSVINLHSGTMKHTPKQDVIMQVLEENLDDGQYFLPNLPKDATQEEHHEYMQNMTGKPWAQINYHKSMSNNMGMNMFRGFVTDFIAALLLCWILLNFSNLTFTKTLLTSLSVGFIGFLTVNYINSIWFETHVVLALFDAIILWGLVGLWLGWWLNRK
ncbi:MAG TPA: hypothetical protein ENK91_14010 [Bacteroidetes bacterium]|nr:hypothetical protein [Bacteroidota bacterium]